jgi:hypothetical protein
MSNVINGPWEDVSEDKRLAKELVRDGGPPHDGGMDPRIDRLENTVDRLDQDLSGIKVSLATINERMTHIPTKAQLLGWGLLAAGVIVAALWKIIAVLLEANNAALAAQLAKSIGH